MQVRDVMTRGVETIDGSATIEEAAARMRNLNVGPLPVVDGGRLIGMVTDRDITVRATAQGLDPKTTRVRDVMTQDAYCTYENADLEEARRIMEEQQIRRLPVLSQDHQLVGIITLGDLAVDTDDDERSGELLAHISEPAAPER